MSSHRPAWKFTQCNSLSPAVYSCSFESSCSTTVLRQNLSRHFQKHVWEYEFFFHFSSEPCDARHDLSELVNLYPPAFWNGGFMRIHCQSRRPGLSVEEVDASRKDSSVSVSEPQCGPQTPDTSFSTNDGLDTSAAAALVTPRRHEIPDTDSESSPLIDCTPNVAIHKSDDNTATRAEIESLARLGLELTELQSHTLGAEPTKRNAQVNITLERLCGPDIPMDMDIWQEEIVDIPIDSSVESTRLMVRDVVIRNLKDDRQFLHILTELDGLLLFSVEILTPICGHKTLTLGKSRSIVECVSDLFEDPGRAHCKLEVDIHLDLCTRPSKDRRQPLRRICDDKKKVQLEDEERVVDRSTMLSEYDGWKYEYIRLGTVGAKSAPNSKKGIEITIAYQIKQWPLL